MKILKIIAKLIVILMFSFAVILLFSQMWLLKTWSDLTAAEVLYHMLAPLNGTNPDMIKGYIMRYLIPALVIIIAIIVAVIVYTKKKEKTKPVYIILLIMSVIMIAFSIVRIERGVGVFSYAVNYLKAKKFQGEDFIEKNYTDPREVSLTFPEKKRNLIYIFLESAEMTFADKISNTKFPDMSLDEYMNNFNENDIKTNDLFDDSSFPSIPM